MDAVACVCVYVVACVGTVVCGVWRVVCPSRKTSCRRDRTITGTGRSIRCSSNRTIASSQHHQVRWGFCDSELTEVDRQRLNNSRPGCVANLAAAFGS